MVTSEIRDSPSLAFRYTVLATMFSNSINSSLIRFARPNRVREEAASWSTMAGELELDLDLAKDVRSLSRFSLRGIDYPAGLQRTSSHLRPRDTSRVHDPSPFTRDQRENPSASGSGLGGGLILDLAIPRGFRITARSKRNVPSAIARALTRQRN